MAKPVLVTGLPRSGTSWAGKMVEAGGRHVYVNEPMNPSHPPGRSPGVLDVDVQHYFQYVSDELGESWLPAFERTVALRYGWRAELRRNRRPYDLARAVRYAAAFARGRRTGRGALIDDPYAIFAVPWLLAHLDISAVVMVREPVAFVGSWRALGWQVDTAELLAQPMLMRDLLGDHRSELEAMAGSTDWLGSAAILWRATYAALHAFADHPRVHVVRHEDLAARPVEGFAALYEKLGIEWTPTAEASIRRATSGGTGSGGGAFRWSLSSGLSRTAFRPMSSTSALGTYRQRLTDEEIARVRELTDDVRALYYASAGLP